MKHEGDECSERKKQESKILKRHVRRLGFVSKK
jgi:hypothetical protein